MSLNNEQLIAISTSSLLLIRTCFKDPNNYGQPFKPTFTQEQLYNVIDFGYDIANKQHDPLNYPETVVLLFPRQTGKTEGVASLIAALLIRWNNADIAVMSATQQRAEDMIERIKFYIVNSDFAFMIKKSNIDKIILSNNARVSSYGDTEKIRGGSYWWIFIDEAGLFSEERINSDALPCTRTAGAYRKFGTPCNILISTPPQTGVGCFIDYMYRAISERTITCQSCHFSYRKNDFAEVRGLDHPRDMPEMPNCPHCGKNSYEYTDGSVGLISQDPWKDRFHTREWILRELNFRGNTAAARIELLGEIISSSNNLLNAEILQGCVNKNLHNQLSVNPNITYIMGVDFGKNRDHTVFSVGHRDKELCFLDYIESIPGEGGYDYEDIRFRLLSLMCQYNPTIMVLDSTGIGDPIVEQINKDIMHIRYSSLPMRYRGTSLSIPYKQNLQTNIYNNKNTRLGYVFDMKTKLDLIDNMVNYFKGRRIMIPEEHEISDLWKELINYGYEYTSTNYIKYNAIRGHDDMVIAFALMCWGLNERPWYNLKTHLEGQDSYVL